MIKKTITKPRSKTVPVLKKEILKSCCSETNAAPRQNIFPKKPFFVGFFVTLLTMSFFLGFLVNQKFSQPFDIETDKDSILNALSEKVLPQKGYKLKISFGDLGKRMVEDGIIDKKKLAKAITGTETLPENLEKYLSGTSQNAIELNEGSAQFWVDVLWGLGLSNKNNVLDKGPMVEGGNMVNYASTGGYTLGTREPMELYSKFSYISLSEKEQTQVEEIAKNVFRPCCGNSTYFPDCNHGMAALGLIELLVSQGKKEEEIYKSVLAFNSYWFPQTYLDIAYHFNLNKRDYSKIPPKEILSKAFSSAMGYAVVRKEVGNIEWPALKGGGSCGA